jgi:hypothetical protein
MLHLIYRNSAQALHYNTHKNSRIILALLDNIRMDYSLTLPLAVVVCTLHHKKMPVGPSTKVPFVGSNENLTILPCILLMTAKVRFSV